MGVLLDFPDPIIARYLDAVRALPKDDRARIDRSTARFFFLSLVQLSPSGAIRVLFAPRIAGLADAMMTEATPEALLEYRKFFRDLGERRWTAIGRIRVALALIALRKRDDDPDEARESYAANIGAVLPRARLGWHDAPTA